VAQARQIFDDNFLSIRAKLIEIAAVLDRMDRAAMTAASRELGPSESVQCDDEPQASGDDPRRARVEEAIGLLLQNATQPGERAAALQQLFSRRYEPQWRQRFEI